MDGVSWVTSDNFDPSKLSLQEAAPRSPGDKDTYERGKLLYEYTPNSKRDLIVTVPRVPDAYLTCRGVQKDTFLRGDTRIETNRYGAQFILKGNNAYHMALYKLFEGVISKIEELTGSTVVFPAKDMDDYSIVYTNLIHSNDGRMYSSAYTGTDHVDILQCGKCVVRPAFLLSTLKRSTTETKIRVQVSQMYIHENSQEFALATQD
jgi:hypothetical protein